MGDFLLEIYSEEIPARMQLDAKERMNDLFLKEASFSKVSFKEVKSFVTPQRLVLLVKNVPESIVSDSEELKGPSISAPEKAIDGFCKSNNLKHDDLLQKEINGKKYFFAIKQSSERKTIAVLQDIVLNILKQFRWPKTMQWESTRTKWVRPIRNILCLFDSEIVDVNFAGLRSNSKTFGHRFMSPGEIKVTTPADYFDTLNKSYVVLDQDERRDEILSQVESLSKQHNIKLNASKSLIDEVTGLVEFPKVIISRISDEFLNLPPEILITSMVLNQKYFPFTDKHGNFSPYFAVISNIKSTDENLVVEGNKKVLEARLHDAKFFYENDLKKSLEDRIPELKKVTFHSKIGSIYDKSVRIAKIASFIANEIGISTKKVSSVARLCKADLVAETVFEFTDLQGTMGKYFALHDGEDKIVASAIEQHYWPVGRDDPCPESLEASIVSIADKIDSIVGLFSVDEKPTSSKDPFALRRAAIGIIRIILDKKLDFTFDSLIEYVSKMFNASASLEVEVKNYIDERFKQFLKDEGFAVEEVNAIVLDNNYFDEYSKAKTISEFFVTDNGKEIYQSVKRINNILASAKSVEFIANPKLFTESSELDLYNQVLKDKDLINSFIKDKNYIEALNQFGGISKLVTKFFDELMVLDKDLSIRNNRLSLLKSVLEMVNKIVDCSKI
ncbi:MAG: glycine--tRNA ligase subunit beta [Rickettsiales bacterium]